MRSHQSWSAEGIEASVRERAEAAARRANMSLGEWMDAAAGAMPQPQGQAPRQVGEIHDRLDAIARQVEQMTAGRTPAGDGVAQQLNDAISRLDVRLSQISQGAPSSQSPYAPSRPAPKPADDLELSIAEIIARQGELDGRSAGHTALRQNAPSFVADGPDFSSLEQQLFNITNQIDTLRRPDGIEQSIAAFRSELGEIRQALTDAMPRKAIESLENEIRSLGRRIDETHQHGADSTALTSIERALSEIRAELRSLTPAEQLTGFDAALHNLGAKIDSIVRSSSDPRTLQQLEDAISALKTIVANVASSDALTQLSDEVRRLAAKVDQLSHASGADMFAALEQRIAVLTSALEQRERPAPADSSYFDNAVRTISDRLDHLQVGSGTSSSLTHVEQRVAHLLERLEATESRPADLGRVEQGLSEVLRVLQQQRINEESGSTARRGPMDQDFIDALRRELTDMRHSQLETDRHTQDSLEVVNNTLGHVVDRLAQIEGDLRQQTRATTEAPRMAPPMANAMPPVPRPELPNPALLQTAVPRAPMRAEPREEPVALTLSSDFAPPPEPVSAAAPPAPVQPRHVPRTPIDPDLPPDHPLEPGSRLQPARGVSPAERIAASESVLKDIPAPAREPVSSSNFIQAARRAAQQAQAASATPVSGTKPNRVTALNDATRAASKAAAAPVASGSSRVRALLVGVSVIVIVLGTFKMAMNLLNSGDATKSEPAAETSVAPPAPSPVPEDSAPKTDAPAPSLTSPTPIGKQSMSAPADRGSSLSVDDTAVAPVAPVAPSAPMTAPAQAPAANNDVTGSIPKNAKRTVLASVTPGEQLPDAIGSTLLRTAALKGDAGAAYEIGLRYAEGRGVAANYDEAAKWYARAAQADIVPAMFRLGTLYEKGLGLKKDVETAARYYRQAADRGNAKAMHNLAVLEADGGGKAPNYVSAGTWFRKAAERGVADSQFNLGILYARGIGVEQNLAESYKWFSLAAAQGDADSGRKRDEISKRLDPQSLAAATLAIQTFTPERQPTEAVNAPAPVGGWDALPGKKKTTLAKPLATDKTASR